MAKTKHLFAVLSLLLFLAGCTADTAPSGNSVLFYYQRADASFQSADGAIGSEPYTFPAALPSYEEFLNTYLTAPEDSSLKSPFPKDLKCLGTSLDNGVLTVIFNDAFAELTGMSRSIAAACITKTVTQFPSVTGVCLEISGDAAGGTEVCVYSDKDYLLEDLGAVNSETAVRLYFSDLNGRYLVGSERKNYFTDAEQIPAYIIQQLIDGPTEAGQLAVMPEGTVLRGINVDDDGVCAVNLSSEFLLNRPTSESLERMTILSIVNSLTELESVKSVRFLVEGKPVGVYLYMDLNLTYQRDESAIGVVRVGLNETDATLYVKCWNDASLAAVPVRLRESSQLTRAETLLEKLVAFKNINGLQNPLPKDTLVQSVSVQGTTCYVDFTESLLDCAGDEAKERTAIHAVVMTLSTLEHVSYVKISINHRNSGFQYFNLDRLYSPQNKWKF